MSRPLAGWLLAAFAAVMIAFAWGDVYNPLVHTTFGITVTPSGSNGRVASVTGKTGSATAGIRPGDIVLLKALTLSDRYRLADNASPAGTALNLSMERRGVPYSATVRARSEQNGGSNALGDIAQLFTATLTLLIVALIALRRPSIASAALVWFGCGSLVTTPMTAQLSWLPDPWFGAVSVVVFAAFSTLPLLALVPFITRFPQAPQTRSARRRMYAGDIVFAIAAAIFAYQSVREPIIFSSWTSFDIWSQVIPVIVVGLFTALAFHDASGEARRRIGWVFAGLALSAVGYMAFDIAYTMQVSTGVRIVPVIAIAADFLQCALPVALGYAILRHRVLDIGFALNRAMVYAIMTTLVIAVVSLVDWGTTRLLSTERIALVLEALLTISFGFALNWLHSGTEHLLDRIVFRARHLAEKRIKSRIDALAFASSASAVDETLAIDAKRILDLSSAAVFGRLVGSAPFTRNASTGWTADNAQSVDDDSILIRTLRAVERPILLDDVAVAPAGFPQGQARAVLAVPIVTQHELIGFAIYGNRREGTLPDPEEISLLADLCAAAGNAYGAVDARRWRERAASLERSMSAMLPAPPALGDEPVT